jgi:hypothetical protein
VLGQATSSYLDYVVAITLGFEYGVAAWLRFKAQRVNAAIRWVYRVSIPCCIIFCASYVWLIWDGDSKARTSLLRIVGIVWAAVAGVLPPLAALRDPRAVAERRRQLQNKSKK